MKLWNWRSAKVGDFRRRRFFALWPRRCSDGTVRWLEHLVAWQEYMYWYDGNGDSGYMWSTHEYWTEDK